MHLTPRGSSECVSKRSVPELARAFHRRLTASCIVLELPRAPQRAKNKHGRIVLKVLADPRSRWMQENSVLEGPRGRWIDENIVLEGPRSRWIAVIDLISYIFWGK